MTGKEFFEQNRGKYFYYEGEKVRVVGYGGTIQPILVSKKEGWYLGSFQSGSVDYIDKTLIYTGDTFWFVDIDKLTPIDQPELDLCKILEGCEGMTFYSPIFGYVILININISLGYPISVSLSDGGTRSFDNNGLYLDIVNAECMLFPSKENRDWSTFKKLIKIKDGTPVMCKSIGAFVWLLIKFNEAIVNNYKWIVPVSEFDFTDFDSNKSKSII